MSIQKKTRNNGFTLVETLVTIFIFSIIMLGSTLLLQNIFKDSGQRPLALETTDQARIIIFNFTNELRNAVSGNDGSYPINYAGDSQIIFYSNYGSSATTQINRIRYYTTGSNLYKGVIAPSGSPASYNTGTETVTTLLTNLANNNTPLFNYYDGNYAGNSTALSQPINVNNVKFVTLNLILPKQDVRNNTSTFSISAGGAIRNLKTNLGN